MNTNDKIKSLGTIFDNMEQLEIKSITEEEYKQLTHKITYMLALAYDRGFADGKEQGKQDLLNFLNG